MTVPPPFLTPKGYDTEAMSMPWDRTVEELSGIVPAGKRWTHVWGVLETAFALGDRHGLDLNQVGMAALLHDCAKCLPLETLESYLRENNLAEDKDDWSSPQVWHALAGAHLARVRFEIEDEDVLRAIRYHPTGTPEMDSLGMVLFLADYTEPSRHYVGSREVRKMAMEVSLPRAALTVCREKIVHVRQKGQEVHSRSLLTLRALEQMVERAP